MGQREQARLSVGSRCFAHADVAVAAEAHAGLSPASLAPTPPNPAPASPACIHFCARGLPPSAWELALPREQRFPVPPPPGSPPSTPSLENQSLDLRLAHVPCSRLCVLLPS